MERRALVLFMVHFVNHPENSLRKIGKECEGIERRVRDIYRRFDTFYDGSVEIVFLFSSLFYFLEQTEFGSG